MTTAEQLLGLAPIICPSDGIADGLCDWHLNGGRVVRITDKGIEVFDPANNADQFCDVLAWLLKTSCVSMHGMPHCVGRGTIEVEGEIENDELIIPHDGTPAGLRQAVTDAAVRVSLTSADSGK